MSERRLISPTGKRQTLAPVHPNAGITVAYQRKLDALIAEMQRSVLYWVRARYRANPPKLATDASPAADLEAEMRTLGTRWTKKFNDAAPDLARWFAKSTNRQADAALHSILRRAGMTVRFQMTATAQDVMTAAISAQVGLIRSIPQQCLTQVQGAVMRSVQRGGDLGMLAKELEQHFGVTRRRAAFIARDQSAKATATITRVRQQELGVTQAIWVHSGGGREPRMSHLRAGRERTVYNIREGWFDPDEAKFILPGELVGCRCVSRAVIPGLG